MISLEPAKDLPFSAIVVRNAINKAFKDKGVLEPVVASVSRSLNKNLVLTTTTSFTGTYLLEKKPIWENLVPCREAVKDEPWSKVVLHSVPIADVDTPNGMDLVLEEIKTFNKNLNPIGKPYWLTPIEKRQNQLAGSIVVSFATDKEATLAIRKRVYIAGISARVKKYYTIAPST